MKKVSISSKLIRDFMDISYRLRRRNLTYGGGGGISFMAGNSNQVLIKGWEVACEDAGPKDIALMDLSGKRLNSVRPCMEAPLHLEVLKARKDIKAVIHAHPPYLTAFGNVKSRLKNGQMKNYPLLQKTAFSPYADPGSKKLADGVAQPFQKEGVICVLMEDHGVTVVGANIHQAYYRLDIMEGMAKTFVLTQLLR